MTTRAKAARGTSRIQQRQIERAKNHLRRIRPFEEWKAAMNPSPSEIEMYWLIVNQFKAVAAGEQQVREVNHAKRRK